MKLTTKPCPNCGKTIRIDSYHNYKYGDDGVPVTGWCGVCGYRWKWELDGEIEGYYKPDTRFFRACDLIKIGHNLFIGVEEESI